MELSRGQQECVDLLQAVGWEAASVEKWWFEDGELHITLRKYTPGAKRRCHIPPTTMPPMKTERRSRPIQDEWWPTSNSMLAVSR